MARDFLSALVSGNQKLLCVYLHTLLAVENWNQKLTSATATWAQCCLCMRAGTILAYGQTGTGKTYTMEGVNDPPEKKGIIPNIFEYVFRQIELSGSGKAYAVSASFLEIYNEEIRDLLASNHQTKLELKEDPERGPYVRNLSQREVRSVQDLQEVLATGTKNRSVGATLMNQDSSRSHSIFSVCIEASDAGAASKDDGKKGITAGKLNLVDLAGSERQTKTGATGDRLKEATKINLSLSALGNVISSLVDGKSQHIPYRDSKLTRLLQDSLGGNCKTVMIANVGPAKSNYEETLSTLRYANRAKAIKNKPKRNEDPKDAKLREYQEEIDRLKQQLSSSARSAQPLHTPSDSSSSSRKQERLEEIKERMRQEMKQEIAKGGSGNTAQVEARAREEMEAYKNEEGRNPEEREAIQHELDNLGSEREQVEKTLRAEEEEEHKLQQQLQQMEAKVLHGNENLLEKEERQKAEIEKQQREIAERKETEEQDRKLMQELEEERLMVDDLYKTIEAEVAGKQHKAERLQQKLRSERQELEDTKNEQARERTQLHEQTSSLASEVQLKSLILHHFIPERMLEQLSDMAVLDGVTGEYTIPHVNASGMKMREKQRQTRWKQQDHQHIQQQHRHRASNGARTSRRR